MKRELAGGVAQPAYRREDLRVGIVHIGVGNFHRAHQAMYLDRLLNQGEAADWAICGVGLLPGDTRVRDALRGQDLRYTLVERSPDGTATARSIASIVDFLYAPDDPEAVFERLAHPDTRIVSLTITEGGYNLADGGRFDADDPLVQRDLAPGATPATVFGVVVEGLRRRRDRGIPPFTVMSCDNLPGNGHVARQSFTSFARLADPELGEWSAARSRSRTAWSTGSPRSPPTRPAATWRRRTTSPTPGRSSARTSPPGCWKTSSPWAARRTRTPGSRWSPTSRRTSR